MTNKLYLVKCRGMHHNVTGVAHGIAYVIASNAEEAYQKVRMHLDINKLGFSDDREMESVTLLAEDYDYTLTKTRLFT